MRLVFLGSGSFAVPTLRKLNDSEHDIAMVITQPSRAKGRGRRTAPTPIAETATALGLPLHECPDVNAEESVARLRASEARLGIVAAFGQKLGPDVLSSLPAGYVNLHASLLPKYRGAAPINWAIVHGEERTGCTVFRIVERMDAGPVLSSRWTQIKPDETAGDLHDRLAAIGVDAVDAALELFRNDVIPPGEAQDDRLATIAPKLKKSDGRIDFAEPVRHVIGRILGMSPWPGAQTRYRAVDGRWEDIQIVRARAAESHDTPDAPPGTIDVRRFVAAIGGFVELLELKPSSGRLMSWADYCNGRHVRTGDSLMPADSGQ